MATLVRKHTLAEYLALPEGEKPYREFVDGEILEKALPNEGHSDTVLGFAELFAPYRRRAGGKCAIEGRVIFATERGAEFRLPDFAYWRPAKRVSDGVHLLPPTLAIEVRSPDESMASQREKCRFYRQHNVEVCWLVDPSSRMVEVFEVDRDAEVVAADGALESPELPGFRLPLATLWATIDEQ